MRNNVPRHADQAVSLRAATSHRELTKLQFAYKGCFQPTTCKPVSGKTLQALAETTPAETQLQDFPSNPYSAFGSRKRTGAIEETPLADFRTCMETNYFGAIRCIQAVMRPMRERGSGTVINVTSVAGKISASPLAPYSASKFAL